MAFFIPDSFHGLFEEVNQRFRLLMRKQVVTGIDETRLEGWLSNFRTDEDLYLAARLLNGLMFRSHDMMCSSIDHLVQCVLPTELRHAGLFEYRSIDAFLDTLKEGLPDHPLRFVGIDGSVVGEEPGKSGAVIIRKFRQHVRISKKLTCRPENMTSLPGTVKAIVFLDDIIGKGTQFGKFATTHHVGDMAADRKLFYCPLVGFKSGIERTRSKHPWLSVQPIEVLDERHRFYYAKSETPSIWAADGHNTVADVKAHVQYLAQAGGIPANTQNGLELLLGFEGATPNNTLPLLWATSDRWNSLLIR